MVRFLSILSVGPALLGQAAAAGWAPADAAALVQRQAKAESRASDEDIDEAGAEKGAETEQEPYAFERYKFGELIEGRSRDGRWLPVIVTGRGSAGNLWNIHVSDEFPGYDLPNVPASHLRRSLAPGLSDYYVDNSKLGHKGLGVNYRSSKNMANKSAEYAPWGSLIVGTDEGDGWVRLSDSYLPMKVHGATVLIKRERNKHKTLALPMAFVRAAEDQRRKAELAMQPKDPTPAPLSYEVGEWVQFRTKAGDWYPAQVAAPSQLPNTYHVVVRLDDGYTVYPVSHVHASRLKKTAPEKHVPKADDSPLCQKDGCISVRVKTNGGKELQLSLSMKSKTEMMMRMACNKLRIEWEDCKARATFKKDGTDMDGSLHVHEHGLKDQDTIEMNVAAETVIDQLLKSPKKGERLPTTLSTEEEEAPAPEVRVTPKMIEEVLRGV